jgi:hypothetical protein
VDMVIFIRENISSGRMLHKEYYCKLSVERKNFLVVGLKGLVAKAN